MARASLDARRHTIEEPPQWPRGVPEQPGYEMALFFMSRLIVSRGHGARKPLRIRKWQEPMIKEVFGVRRRQSFGVLPRGNGKSTLAAAMSLTHVLTDYPIIPGPSVALVGSNEEQARRVLAVARRFVETNSALADRCKVYKDRIVFVGWDAEIVAYPANATALLGLDVSMVVLDEIAAMPLETYEAVVTGMGKRPKSMIFGIGSRMPGECPLLDRLCDYAGSADGWADKAFNLIEWKATDGCPVDDEHEWMRANPALKDFLAIDSMRALVNTVPENVFRAYRLNQRVDAVGQWIARDAWINCEDQQRTLNPGDEICIGFDGSLSGDASAISVCTMDYHLAKTHVWEGDRQQSSSGHLIPRDEVDAVVRNLFATYKVRRMLCDPWGWTSEIIGWQKSYGEDIVLNSPCNAAARYGPISDRFFTRVVNRGLTHDGDRKLHDHVLACAGKATPYGTVPIKQHQGVFIDAAVAATLSIEAAYQIETMPAPKAKKVMAFA